MFMNGPSVRSALSVRLQAHAHSTRSEAVKLCELSGVGRDVKPYLFRDVRWRKVATDYSRFGTVYRSCIQRSKWDKEAVSKRRYPAFRSELRV